MLKVATVRFALSVLAAFATALVVATPATSQDDFPRTIASIDDDRRGLVMALELFLNVYRPLAAPRRHGDFLVDQEIQPGSAEETILRYIQLAVSGDTTGMAELHEPGQAGARNDGSCPCGPLGAPYYRIPDSFKLLSFRYAWLYRDYTVFMVTFQESARMSSGVFISTRRHDGRVLIAARPGGPVYDTASFLLSLADPDRSPASLTDRPPGHLNHTVRIDGGASPIDMHFTGILQSSGVDWQPAGQTAPTGEAAVLASNVLATSAELSDEAFIELFHPWVVGNLKSRVASEPDYLADVRAMYMADTDIAHVFTFDVGHRLLHTYLAEDQPDRLRHMLIMRDGPDLALAGTPPEFGLASMMEIDAVQQYLFDIWRDQD